MMQPKFNVGQRVFFRWDEEKKMPGEIKKISPKSTLPYRVRYLGIDGIRVTGSYADDDLVPAEPAATPEAKINDFTAEALAAGWKPPKGEIPTVTTVELLPGKEGQFSPSNAIVAIVNAIGAMPGRKVIVTCEPSAAEAILAELKKLER